MQSRPNVSLEQWSRAGLVAQTAEKITLALSRSVLISGAVASGIDRDSSPVNLRYNSLPATKRQSYICIICGPNFSMPQGMQSVIAA